MKAQIHTGNREAKSEARVFRQTTVADVMSREPYILQRNDTLAMAEDIMRMNRIRHFPVLDADKLVGVISQRDLFHAALGSVMRYGEAAERAFLATVVVKEVLSAPAVTITPEASVSEAARLMIEKKIGCLPVLEQNRLIGIITETDILRQVAEAGMQENRP